MIRTRAGWLVVLIAALGYGVERGSAQVILTPRADRSPIPLGTTVGQRPDRFVIRDAVMITGRGTPNTGRAAPPEGPVDIVVENGVIVDIVPADEVSLRGYGPDAPRPTGALIIEAGGRYVMPGLVDMHAHVPPLDHAGPEAPAYSFRLWLGHGVTTLRDPGTGAGLELMARLRDESEAHSIVAPRLRLYQRWPRRARMGGNAGHTPEEARELVRSFRSRGADGIKVSHGPGHYPDVLRAIVDEVRATGMNGVAVDLKVGETDAVVASDAGVTSIEHWYGIPDAALPGTQNFPPDYNYLDEVDRFRWAGRLWQEAARYPDEQSRVIDRMIENGTAWTPTFQIYEASTDWVRIATLPWRDRFVHPSMREAWQPRADVHASFHYDWKTSDEIAWKENFRLWMEWVREFWSRGGVVTLGSDSGSQQSLYGFGLIRELELLQQAGIHPLDVIKIGTTNSASVLGLGDELCGIRIGCVADLVVVDGNPLDNFKVLYGAGFAYYEMGREERGGVIWTIKAGEIFDAQALLREAEWYVEQERARLNIARAEGLPHQ